MLDSAWGASESYEIGYGRNVLLGVISTSVK